MEKKFNFYIGTDSYGDRVNFHIGFRENGKRYVVKPLVFEEVNEGHITPPAIALKFEDQSLITAMADALVRFGVFQKHDDAQVSAIKYHLEDMRKLVFKKE